MNDFSNMPMRYDPNGGMVEFGDDARLFVEFVSRSVLDGEATKEAGRPVHKQVDYVRIRQPGERDEIFKPADRTHQMRFRRQWQDYQEGRESRPEGSPLDMIFPTNPEIVENLKYDKIFTVEQLAALSDTQLGNIGMGARQWQDKAKAFLDAAKKGANYQKLAKQMEEMQAQMAAMAERNKALEEALDEATKKKGE